jgi:hypothetical protein
MVRRFAAMRLVAGFALLVGCGADETVAGPVLDATANADSARGEVSLADAAATDSAGARVDHAPANDVLACPTGACAIDGECVANLGAHPTNPCLKCLAVVSTTTWSPFAAATCDDGNLCTTADTCSDGNCQGTPLNCADPNPCTGDSCDAKTGSCVHLPSAATCDDGSACTAGDTCAAGACTGAQVACDDGNNCTSDACDAQTGCTTAPSAGICDDGNACTANDGCNQGTCKSGEAVNCDDQDVCSVDSCDKKSGCQHVSLAAKCKDDNPCTDDGCDKQLGCVFAANAIPCDDGSLCTAGDACKATACIGMPVATDDGNPCTDDACEPKSGVAHVPNSAPCDDQNACTVGDLCKGGTCLPGPALLPCADTNTCTDDACDPKQGCTFTPNTSPCNDGSVCTLGDTCKAGACTAASQLDCDDKNTCTSDSCDKIDGCKHVLQVSNACRPVIIVDYPPRAATLKEPDGQVPVKGTVKSGAGPITAFQLNGKDVAVTPNGEFTTSVPAKVGGNTLVFTAKDSFGSAKKRVQSFLWSTTWFKPVLEQAKSGMVDPGIGYWLSQGVIDDGKHDLPPNDLATIFELYLKSLDLAKLIGAASTSFTIGFATYTVTLSNAKVGQPNVTLKSQPGGMKMTATFLTVSADVHAKGPLVDTKGKMAFDSIVITADVVPSVQADHKLAVALQNVDVQLNGMKVQLSGIIGALVNGFPGLIKPQIEKAFEDQVAKSLGPGLASALNALAFNSKFQVGKLDGSGGKIDVFLETDFSGVQFDTPGGVFLLRARATAKKAVPYDNLGVPGRIGCGNGKQTLVVLKQSPLELSIADDEFNELLHATWTGGLYEFPVPASMLGNVDLKQYGVSDLTMKVSAMLAPTLDDCNAKQAATAHVGDLRVDAKLKLFGQPMDVTLYASFLAGVEITAKDGAIGIALKEVQQSDLQVDVQQDNMVASEGVLEKLVAENLIAGLVKSLGGSALGSFPLPAIDLSAAMPGLPPGTGIQIVPQKVTRQGGNSIVGGTLK